MKRVLLILLCIVSTLSYAAQMSETEQNQHWSFKQQRAIEAMSRLVEGNNQKKLRQLVQRYPEIINARNKHGATALIFAVLSGHKDLVQLLIDAGADPNIRDIHSSTALFYAADKGNKEIAQLLIATGAQIDIQNNIGFTALMLATKEGHKDIVQLLINAGAQLDIQDERYYTALMQAVLSGHKDILQLLINAGAQLDIQNYLGETASVIAVLLQRYDILQMLIAAGSNSPLAYSYAKTFGKEAEYLEATEERKRYLQEQPHAQSHIAEHLTHIPDLANIVTDYAYGQSPEDLPRSISKEPEEKLQATVDKKN